MHRMISRDALAAMEPTIGSPGRPIDIERVAEEVLYRVGMAFQSVRTSKLARCARSHGRAKG
jgi:hypothetical protein